MKYRQLGRSALRVSEVGLGTWQTFGQTLDEAQSKALVREAFELGITFFDTADVYADGAAEISLGKALVEHSRSAYVVATKCFFPWPGDAGARGLSRTHIRRAAERSLRNLRVDALDLLQCHRFDPETPLAETCEAMAELVREGKIRHWGVGRFTVEQLEQVMALGAVAAPISDQHVYNALNREIEAEILPKCAELGLGMIAYSPLAQGVLTGKYLNGSVPVGSRAEFEPARQKMWELQPEQLERVAHWSALARTNGTTVLALALGYCLRAPAVSSVLIGASSPGQLRANVDAALTPIDLALLKQVEVS